MASVLGLGDCSAWPVTSHVMCFSVVSQAACIKRRPGGCTGQSHGSVQLFVSLTIQIKPVCCHNSIQIVLRIDMLQNFLLACHVASSNLRLYISWYKTSKDRMKTMHAVSIVEDPAFNHVPTVLGCLLTATPTEPSRRLLLPTRCLHTEAHPQRASVMIRPSFKALRLRCNLVGALWICWRFPFESLAYWDVPWARTLCSSASIFHYSMAICSHLRDLLLSGRENKKEDVLRGKEL